MINTKELTSFLITSGASNRSYPIDIDGIGDRRYNVQNVTLENGRLIIRPIATEPYNTNTSLIQSTNDHDMHICEFQMTIGGGFNDRIGYFNNIESPMVEYVGEHHIRKIRAFGKLVGVDTIDVIELTSDRLMTYLTVGRSSVIDNCQSIIITDTDDNVSITCIPQIINTNNIQFICEDKPLLSLAHKSMYDTVNIVLELVPNNTKENDE